MAGAFGCRIRVVGELGLDWTSWFAGLTVEPGPDGTTDLVGELPDQAALFGLLTAVRDVGLALVALETTGVANKEEARG